MKRPVPLLSRFLILTGILLMPVGGRAQYFTVGTDPWNLRWQESRIGPFTLLFPQKDLQLASRFNRVLEVLEKPVTASMQAQVRKVPLILHPFSSVSNGVTVLAPRRIELFPKPPLALETNDFIPQLLIHEVRHIAQMEQLNAGFTRVAGYFLGEQAQSAVLAIHVPKWILEGDAVLTETLLSQGGRGRMAGFMQPLRSRLIDHKDLSWDRVMLGTYNDILPDEYLFGYFLTARGRMLSDPLLWSDAIRQIGRNPFYVKGLSGLTRRKTGFHFSKLYVETLSWLRDYWTSPALRVKKPEHLRTLVRDTTVYQHYYRPQRFSDHELVCLKKSILDLPALVAIDTSGTERILARPGTVEDAGFTCRNGILVWAELIRDPRWENRSWSDLFRFDKQTGKSIRLTHGQRYFSPVFDFEGNKLAVIRENPDGSSGLCILDAASGRELEDFPAGTENHFSYLCWGTTPQEIFAIITGQAGRRLVRIDLRTGLWETLVDAGFKDISCPASGGYWVYFSGPAGTTPGLYRVNRITRELELVFAHPHGINYLNVDGDELLMSVYSSNGYRPASIPLRELSGTPKDRVEPLAEPVTGIIQRAPGEFPVEFPDTASVPRTGSYKKVAHLFRFHSWSPVFIDPDAYQVSPGLALMSQNDLSTLVAWAGYQWSKPDQSHNLIASLRYTGFLPELRFDLNRRYRERDRGAIQDTTGFFLILPYGYWQTWKASASVPLLWSSGAWNRKLRTGIFAEQVTNLTQKDPDRNRSAWMAGLEMNASLLRKTSYRDLFPQWGASLDAAWFKSFYHDQWRNNFTIRLMTYIPGFLPNSSIRMLHSAMALGTPYYFPHLEDFPRGQVIMHARRNYNFKIDFAFPVAYPDYHVSWLIYIKRIKTDLFFDAGTPLDYSDWFSSAGVDLTMDYHLLRIGIELESGLRMMYFPTTHRAGLEFLFSFAVN